MAQLKQSYKIIPDNLLLRTLSYCSLILSSWSRTILSQIMATCLKVNNGTSFCFGELNPEEDCTDEAGKSPVEADATLARRSEFTGGLCLPKAAQVVGGGL